MFLELEVDSQLGLALLPGSWEEMSFLAHLMNWWLECEPNPHFRLPLNLLLSVEG